MVVATLILMNKIKSEIDKGQNEMQISKTLNMKIQKVKEFMVFFKDVEQPIYKEAV